MVLVVFRHIKFSCALDVPWLSPRQRVASSSRSQVAAPTARVAACPTWEAPSVDVRWRPPVSVVVVSHLVTHPIASRCSERLFGRSSSASLRLVMLQLSDQHASPWMTALLLPYSPTGRVQERTPALPPAYRLGNVTRRLGKRPGNKTSLGTVQLSWTLRSVYRLLRTNKYAAPDPGSAGIPDLAVR
jgi:hypothetical protein